MRAISKRTTSVVAIALAATIVVLLMPTAALALYSWTGMNLEKNVRCLAYDGSRNILYAGCENNNVYESDFDGAGWSSTGSLGSAVYSLAYDADRNILYAGCAAGNVFKNELKGAGWSTKGSLGPGPIYSLAYDPARNILYAGCASGDVYKNEFKGAGWSATGNLASPAYSLAYDASRNVLYAGCAAGNVFKNELRGAGWSTTGSLGAGPVYSLAYDPTRNILYAGCAAGDVFKNELKGAGWSTTGDLGSGPVYSLTCDEANNVLYAGTSGASTDNVFKKNLSVSADWFVIGRLCGGGGGGGVYALQNAETNDILYAGTIDSPLGNQDVYRFGLPSINQFDPVNGKQGQTLDVEITGKNTDFRSNVKAHFSGSGIKVNSTKRVSATKITGNISIAADAALGQRDVWVTYKDSDGVEGRANMLPGALMVISNTAFYFAEGTCRPGFDPYICIENPGSTDAEVTITYMKGDGSTDTQGVTVPKNSRSTVTVKNKLGEGDDTNHDFSAEVECTNGQNIIAERSMYFNYKSIWTGGHDVVGSSQPYTVGIVRPSPWRTRKASDPNSRGQTP